MAVGINAPSETISATTTTARVAYPISGKKFVRVFNEGTTTVWLASGDSTITAVAKSGQFLPGGKSAVFQHNENDTHIAALMASGTATIYVSPCEANELVGF